VELQLKKIQHQALRDAPQKHITAGLNWVMWETQIIVIRNVAQLCKLNQPHQQLDVLRLRIILGVSYKNIYVF